jgi:hypothetical protein
MTAEMVKVFAAIDHKPRTTERHAPERSRRAGSPLGHVARNGRSPGVAEGFLASELAGQVQIAPPFHKYRTACWFT